MKNKKLVLGILLLAIVLAIFISDCVQEKEEKIKDPVNGKKTDCLLIVGK